ncbi:amino acid permease [Listeria ivanovii]|uniref:Putative amino acid transporter n=1 Tax=Listeria ivanovii (strain ATCC BAA-678 / PAM 55) TaxID=881621 RepID=G2ZD90_LISIP|nr:amino acid permease [Listeria ivanovii]MCJ1716480.1 amino acid permease [Listeria ivanovii]MCJ1721612.1 amino acid permease [Listeria ivanovii]MCJ1734373.1 amino acid permease [Listeria ivanovii]CBW85202.1 Putative amino acid transporter [Listeria ivanovii subsp. ivanovii PAM 55]
MAEQKEELQRGLKNRHIQLIAIGGAIGTGLFLGAGKSIHLAGPSIMLVYLIIGAILFFVMRALGELLIHNPTTGSFTEFAEQYIGPWAGFITGWTYWFCWIVTGIAEITAVGMYVKFWVPDLPQWIPALACVLILLLFNLATVKAFGEIEFWFAIIKVVVIIALIVIGFVLVFMGYKHGTSTASFSNLVDYGGFFPNGIAGFLLAFQMATFSFVGIELVGVTAGEADDPDRTLPKAINNIPIRILIFYIGALLVLMSIYPWSNIDPNTSPFVSVFTMIGIPAAAGIINFVVLTAAMSSCNSGIFSTSRMLYTLSAEGKAPKKMHHLSSNGVQATALITSTACLLIGVFLNYFLPEQVFILVTSIATICFIWVWGVILVAHLRFRQKHPEIAAKSKFKMPLSPFMNWVSLIFFGGLLIILGFAADTRIALFVTPVWFLLLAFAYQVLKASNKKSKIRHN